MTKRTLSLHQNDGPHPDTGAEPRELDEAESAASEDEIAGLDESEETERDEEGEEAIDGEAAVAVDEAGAQALITEPRREFSPTLDLPTPHHWRLVKVAVADRIASLKSIAKKVSDEGYTREARTMEQDAMALSEDVAPQLETQAEIPLATADEVQSGVVNSLRDLVRRHVRRDRQDVDDEALLLRYLGERIERYARDIAERAYAAGLAAREAEAEVFALKSLNALRK